MIERYERLWQPAGPAQTFIDVSEEETRRLLVTMKILVLSHAGVVDVNRALFRELKRLGADVVMVVPCDWKGERV